MQSEGACCVGLCLDRFASPLQRCQPYEFLKSQKLLQVPRAANSMQNLGCFGNKQFVGRLVGPQAGTGGVRERDICINHQSKAYAERSRNIVN